MSNEITREQEIEVLAAALLRKKSNQGWLRAATVDDIPETCGYYSLYDGIEGRGSGVTLDMRADAKASPWSGKMERPIFLYQSDVDGSAALWLDGKIRCDKCEGGPTFEIGEKYDDHMWIEHGISDGEG